MIRVGQQLPDGVDIGPAVSQPRRLLGIERVLLGPVCPNTEYGRRRVHQDSVQIKQDCATFDPHHFLPFWLGYLGPEAGDIATQGRAS